MLLMNAGPVAAEAGTIWEGSEVTEITRILDIKPDGDVNYTYSYNAMDPANVTSTHDTWGPFFENTSIDGSWIGSGPKEGLYEVDHYGEIAASALVQAPANSIMSGASEGWIRTPFHNMSGRNITMDIYHVDNHLEASLHADRLAQPLVPVTWTNTDDFHAASVQDDLILNNANTGRAVVGGAEGSYADSNIYGWDKTGNGAVGMGTETEILEAAGNGGAPGGSVWGMGEGPGQLEAHDNGPWGIHDGTLLSASFTLNGRLGAGVHFDGVNDRIKIDDHNDLDMQGDYISFGAWVKPFTFGVGDAGVIMKEDAYGILITSSGQTACIIMDGVNVGGIISAEPILLNEWTHLACTYTGTYIRLYINAVMEPAQAYTHPPGNNNNDLYIGLNAAGPDYFSGIIDEAFLSSAHFVPDDITDIYNGQYVANTIQKYRSAYGTMEGIETPASGLSQVIQVDMEYATANMSLDHIPSIRVLGSNTSTDPDDVSVIPRMTWAEGNDYALSQSNGIQGIEFDGVDDYLIASYEPTWDFSVDYSVSFWLNADGEEADDTYDDDEEGWILAKGDMYDTTADSSRWGVYYGARNTGSGTFIRLYTGSQLAISQDLGSACVEKWCYLTVTKNAAGDINFYINSFAYGSAVGAIAKTFNSDEIYIGTRQAGMPSPPAGNYPMDMQDFLGGRLSDLRIFNASLTPEQVQDLYNGGPGYDTAQSNLVAKWLFDDQTQGTVQWDTAGASAISYGFDTDLSVYNTAAVPCSACHLAGLWLMDEGAGQQARDSTVYHNHGTFQNSGNNYGMIKWDEGKYGMGLLFDDMATMDSLHISNPLEGTNTILSPSNDAVYSLWFKADSTNPQVDKTLFTHCDIYANCASSGKGGLEVWFQGGVLHVKSEAGGQIASTCGGNCYDDQWHHLGIRINGGGPVLELWMDGVLVQSMSLTNFAPVGDIYIGDSGWALGYEGMVDEFAIYRGDADIAAIYSMTSQNRYESGLVMYLPYQENLNIECVSLTTEQCTADKSGLGNHPIIRTTPSGNVPATWSSGMLDTGLYFDGVNDWIKQDNPCSNNAQCNMESMTDGFSATTWFKFAEYPDGGTKGTLVSRTDWSTVSANNHFLLGLGSDGKVKCTFYSMPNYIDITLSGTTVLDVDKWHHAACIHDGNNLKIFVNGVKEHDSVVGGSGTWNQFYLVVGAAYNNQAAAAGWTYWKGWIDETAYFTRTLTDAQAVALYTLTQTRIVRPYSLGLLGGDGDATKEPEPYRQLDPQGATPTWFIPKVVVVNTLVPYSTNWFWEIDMETEDGRSTPIVYRTTISFNGPHRLYHDSITPTAHPTLVWNMTYTPPGNCTGNDILRYDFDNRNYLWWSFPWFPDEHYVMVFLVHGLKTSGTTSFYMSQSDLAYDGWNESDLSIYSPDFLYRNFTLPVDLGVSVLFTEGQGYGVRGDSIESSNIATQNSIGMAPGYFEDATLYLPFIGYGNAGCPLQEYECDTVPDYSGESNHGRLVRQPSYTVTGMAADGPYIDHADHITGNLDPAEGSLHIDQGAHASVDFLQVKNHEGLVGFTQVTISFWMKMEGGWGATNDCKWVLNSGFPGNGPPSYDDGFKCNSLMNVDGVFDIGTQQDIPGCSEYPDGNHLTGCNTDILTTDDGQTHLFTDEGIVATFTDVNGNDHIYASKDGTISQNTWHHVVVVVARDDVTTGARARIYIDGIDETRDTWYLSDAGYKIGPGGTGVTCWDSFNSALATNRFFNCDTMGVMKGLEDPSPPVSNFRLGLADFAQWYTGGNDILGHYNGRFDEIVIWKNRALSPPEVATLNIQSQNRYYNDITLAPTDGIVFFDRLNSPFNPANQRLTFTMPFLIPENSAEGKMLVSVFAIGLDSNLQMMNANSWTANTQVVTDHIIISGRDEDIPYSPNYEANRRHAWGYTFNGEGYDDYYDKFRQQYGGKSAQINGDEALAGATYIKFVMGWADYIEGQTTDYAQPSTGVRYWLWDGAGGTVDEDTWILNKVYYYHDWGDFDIVQWSEPRWGGNLSNREDIPPLFSITNPAYMNCRERNWRPYHTVEINSGTLANLNPIMHEQVFHFEVVVELKNGTVYEDMQWIEVIPFLENNNLYVSGFDLEGSGLPFRFSTLAGVQGTEFRQLYLWTQQNVQRYSAATTQTATEVGEEQHAVAVSWTARALEAMFGAAGRFVDFGATYIYGPLSWIVTRLQDNINDILQGIAFLIAFIAFMAGTAMIWHATRMMVMMIRGEIYVAQAMAQDGWRGAFKNYDYLKEKT